MRQRFIVPSIRGRDVGFPEWPDIRSFEHLFQLLDFIDYAFNVHPQQYSEPALTRHFCTFGREAFHLHSLTLCENSQINDVMKLCRPQRREPSHRVEDLEDAGDRDRSAI